MSFTLHTILHMIVLSRLTMTLTLTIEARGSGVGKAWDVSPSLQPNSHRLPWPRTETSPLEIRTISGVGRLPQQFKDNFPIKQETEDTDLMNRPLMKDDDVDEINFERQERKLSPYLRRMDNIKLEELLSDEDKFEYSVFTEAVPRVRRDLEPKMEQISASKSVREARLNSPESWSKQPIAIEFRHRTPLHQVLPENQEIPISTRRSHMPQTDFITSNRRYFAESRESREMPVARTYDDYDVPIYSNHDRNYDSYSHGYYYPNRYRTERDYRYRGESMPPPQQPPSPYYDQYPMNNFESYERNRIPTKQKRIIYYATLPEIVRKPEINNNYPRPYDGPPRIPPGLSVSRNSLGGQKYHREQSMRPFFRYPYDNYDFDGYKRPAFYDRNDPYHKDSGHRNDHYNKENGHRTPSDRDLVPTHKENLRRDDDLNIGQERKTRDNQDLPWPVQIGTEVNVKEHERIPGRKIFGQSQNFDRYESAPLKQAPNEPDKIVEHSS
ncbi:uncharacterized protein LOC127283938 isoform X2 [Leptopilina boulardi]|uniref:uncharacterized protein LOC127283938 isoform X2 n=1 Tax=Leptopilina boulardi TaxID=63433 RepID=UPI0021F5985F|nr:uncharacterized protein LOC127283938 isoform X2 [Leptopilina boulardi]